VTQSGTRIFHYDLKGHLIAETNQSGEMTAEYVYLGDQLLAMITKPGETEIVSYFHNDHLGTPQVLTNDSQTIVWKAAYTPFGRAEISTEAVENPHRFPGQYYDPETGLHYNYFRYYDPTTGRYVTPDPIGLEGGINLYPYVGGNPLRWMDRFGLQTAAPGVAPFPLPFYIPPVATHGSKENKAFVEFATQLRDKIRDAITEAVKEGIRESSDASDWRRTADIESWPWWQENVGPMDPPSQEPPDEKKRCEKVKEQCTNAAVDLYVDNPNALPGCGRDMKGRIRRSIRECMELNGCYNY
jgi:RHS repeat-associated protein